MGLFNKLKNVLFEEEEVEIPVEEPKKQKIKRPEIEKSGNVLERKKNVYEEEEKEDNTPIISDRELFKAEKTFDFPVFDDQEFESMKTPTKPLEEEPKKTIGINLFDYEKPKIKRDVIRTKTPEIKGRAYEPKKNVQHKFQPSPVISPVYGVLDKNYKKEDIIVAKEEKKSIDVDDVRKKAFGTLEDDIEKNLFDPPKMKKQPEKEEIKKEDTTIDDLLEATAFDRIEVPDSDDQPIETDTIELEVLDQKNEKTEEEKIKENDTLENDLFDLIDSMYEDREDE